jgi:2-oxoglutarate dehydrogenase E1 component
VTIDQFVASAGTKWGQHSGLVMLLPHGYEGQGPEHSSARPERFLQLCANNNMQVVNCSTPANFYHVLRRQLKRKFRIPLVVMTPKSLLRHPQCVSSIEDFMEPGFKALIDDGKAEAKKVRKVLLCSGKLYFDLLEHSEKEKVTDVAIVRIEQLYPLPEKQLKSIFDKYKKASFAWVQEEPMNMGAWMHIGRYELPFTPKYIGRGSSASPASGFKKTSDAEMKAIIEEAFS